MTPAAGYSPTRRRALYFALFVLLLLATGVTLSRSRAVIPAAAVAPQLWTDAPLAAGDLSWRHGPGLFAAGLVAGLLTGLLGMGGGVFKIALLLLLFRLDIFFARAIAVVTMLGASAIAVWRHVKVEQVVWRVAAPMALLGLPAAAVAAVLGNALPAATLEALFGAFVLLLALGTLALHLADPARRGPRTVFDAGAARRSAGYHGATIGALQGAICGLFGVSGAVIATPLQQLLLRTSRRQALATTLLVATGVTLVASCIVLWGGLRAGDFTITDLLFVDMFMGTGVAVGAPLGTQLAARCSVATQRITFTLLTLGAGIGIIW